jgi:peptidoglycan hydrolase-like protein with peptidoglycan-binding domain
MATTNKASTAKKRAATRKSSPPAPTVEQAAPPRAEDDNEVARLSVGKPILTDGAADPRVNELTAKLSELGYEVAVGDTVNGEVLAAVRQFRKQHKVEEDPDIARGGDVDNYIGPETWAALARLS